MIDGLPEIRQLAHRVEHAGQKGQRQDDEVRHHRDMIEVPGPHAADQPQPPHDQRTGDAIDADQRQMLKADVHKRHQHQQKHGGNDHGAHDGRKQEGAHHLERRQRRHQQVDMHAHDLAHDHRAGGVGKGVLQHRHHRQARNQKGEIVHLQSRHMAIADRIAEDDQIQKGGQRRRDDGLHLHLQETPDLAHKKGFRADEIHAQPSPDVCRPVSRRKTSSRSSERTCASRGGPKRSTAA